jgi:hypothetical protein
VIFLFWFLGLGWSGRFACRLRAVVFLFWFLGLGWSGRFACRLRAVVFLFWFLGLGWSGRFACRLRGMVPLFWLLGLGWSGRFACLPRGMVPLFWLLGLGWLDRFACWLRRMYGIMLKFVSLQNNRKSGASSFKATNKVYRVCILFLVLLNTIDIFLGRQLQLTLQKSSVKKGFIFFCFYLQQSLYFSRSDKQLSIAELASACYKIETYECGAAVDSVKAAFADAMSALVVQNLDISDGDLRKNVCAATQVALQSLGQCTDITVVAEVCFLNIFFFPTNFFYRRLYHMNSLLLSTLAGATLQ